MSGPMLRILVVAVVNLVLLLRHAWNALWRNRVDFVRLDVAGELPEVAARPGFLQRRLQRGPPVLTALALRRQLERVAADRHCRGVVLRLKHLGAGTATLQGVRAEVARVRAAGKRVVAFLEEPSQAAFYLACAAGEVVMPPSAWLHLTGFRAGLLFWKDALARVGLHVEVEAVSPYKSAAETLARADISPENREQLSRLLDGRLLELVTAVAEGRRIPPERVRELLDRAPFSAAAAKEAGLVDALRYEDELEAHLRGDGKAVEIVDWDDADGMLRKPYRRWRRPRPIAVVPVVGTILRGRSHSVPVPLPLLGSRQAGAETVATALRQAERNKAIKAVVLYVDSRGGDAYASDLIWREVLRLRKRKPVVAVMGNAAASGGYYVAAPAHAILAQPGTLTGSIGVLATRPVAADLAHLASVHPVAIERGANSGMLDPLYAPSDSERAALRNLVAVAYGEFLERVAEGRAMARSRVEELAGGRVWLGVEALRHGLVDGLGGLREGVAKAQELAGLPLDPDAPLVFMPGGGHVTPRPFPDALAALPEDLHTLLKPGLWAILPFHDA